jgi:hypothetical protein
MTHERAHEQRETKLANTEATPQAIWLTAKSLIKRDGAMAQTAIHGPLGLKFLLLAEALTIADGLENRFTSYNM